MINRGVAEIKAKIRHFLLKNSTRYSRAVTQGKEVPSTTSLARELQKKCPIGERRLQKYLYESTPSKDLTISLEDLVAFAKLGECSLGVFISYLMQEESSLPDIDKAQAEVLRFFSLLSLRDRRELRLRIFNPSSFLVGEEAVRQALRFSKLNTKQRKAIIQMIEVMETSSIRGVND